MPMTKMHPKPLDLYQSIQFSTGKSVPPTMRMVLTFIQPHTWWYRHLACALMCCNSSCGTFNDGRQPLVSHFLRGTFTSHTLEPA